MKKPRRRNFYKKKTMSRWKWRHKRLMNVLGFPPVTFIDFNEVIDNMSSRRFNEGVFEPIGIGAPLMSEIDRDLLMYAHKMPMPMVGIPGSGKSNFVEDMRIKHSLSGRVEFPIEIDPDIIKRRFDLLKPPQDSGTSE